MKSTTSQSRLVTLPYTRTYEWGREAEREEERNFLLLSLTRACVGEEGRQGSRGEKRERSWERGRVREKKEKAGEGEESDLIVDLHLIDGDTWLNRVHRIAINISRRSRRGITVKIKSRKMHLMRPIAIKRQAFRCVL